MRTRLRVDLAPRHSDPMPDCPITRLVLDTNTVMALWFFEDPALQRLRRAVEERPVELVSRIDALDELRSVLAYRQFAITEARQADLMREYTARCALVRAALCGDDTLPRCRDPLDQKFLEIARDSGASHLVSRDKALLTLDRHRRIRPLFAIVTPEALCAGLD